MPALAGFMDAGLLVPDKIVCAVVSERLSQADCSRSGNMSDVIHFP